MVTVAGLAFGLLNDNFPLPLKDCVNGNLLPEHFTGRKEVVSTAQPLVFGVKRDLQTVARVWYTVFCSYVRQFWSLGGTFIMIGHDTHDVERKVISILKVLNDSREPIGARVVARELKNHGVELTERAVRYHLKLMDGRGLTQLFGRDGRMITDLGREELKSALVTDKVGFVISKIELLAFCADFDPERKVGRVVVNTSFFSREKFKNALAAMRGAFQAGICVSDRVAVAYEGQRLGEAVVPPGQVGFATVCSITINAALLKAGVPMGSRFGGILQIRRSRPLRFTGLINYEGSTLDPSEIFIRGKMTLVGQAASTGEGKILANFREIPAQCGPLTDAVIARLQEAGIGGVVIMGNPSEPVCEIPVGLNRVGVILYGGLNPVAAAEEAGIEAENQAMSGVIDYQELVSFWDL